MEVQIRTKHIAVCSLVIPFLCMLLAPTRLTPAPVSKLATFLRPAPSQQRRSTASMALSREDAGKLTGKPETVPVWQAFYDLTRIPRMSKHEAAVLQHIQGLADERDLTHKSDARGNLVVFRPGSGSGKHAATVIVQSHVDMVCEKNDDVQVCSTWRS